MYHVIGFLNTNVDPDRNPQMANYGLMDQIAALKWVQENVKAFGGDPESITVFGHNTGAASIHFLMQSPIVLPGNLKTRLRKNFFTEIHLLSGCINLYILHNAQNKNIISKDIEKTFVTRATNGIKH